MEVLLPHNFNKNLLVIDNDYYLSRSSGMRKPMFELSCYRNGDHHPYDNVKYNLSTKECWSCQGIGVQHCGHDDDVPPKAIYNTGLCINSRSSQLDGNRQMIKCNLSDRLITIFMNREIFSTFPQADYCVIQCEEFTKAYKLNLIVEYPQPVIVPIKRGSSIIGHQPDENYPNIIRQSLEERNPKYNGEQNYQLIQRQVLLARMFGNMNIELKEFQKLLLIDSAVLNSSITALAKEMNITLYSCEFVNRINLLKTFHGNMFANIDTVAPSGLIQAFSSDIEKLKQLSVLVEKILLHESDIIALKTRVIELEKENTELKAINTKQSTELETANVSKSIMDKLISENNNYKSALLVIKDKVNFLEG